MCLNRRYHGTCSDTQVNQNYYENIERGIKNGANEGLTAAVAFMALYGSERCVNHVLRVPLAVIGIETNWKILNDETDFGGLSLLTLGSFTLIGALFGGLKALYTD